MNKLVANFDVQLLSRLLIKRDKNDELYYEVKIDNFDVKLETEKETRGVYAQ